MGIPLRKDQLVKKYQSSRSARKAKSEPEKPKAGRNCSTCALCYKSRIGLRCARFILSVADGADAPRVLPHPRVCIGFVRRK
jgi:hypothetical protein